MRRQQGSPLPGPWASSWGWVGMHRGLLQLYTYKVRALFEAKKAQLTWILSVLLAHFYWTAPLLSLGKKDSETLQQHFSSFTESKLCLLKKYLTPGIVCGFRDSVKGHQSMDKAYCALTNQICSRSLWPYIPCQAPQVLCSWKEFILVLSKALKSQWPTCSSLK